MKRLFSSLCAHGLILSLCFSANAIEPEELKRRLLQKDQALDNALLRYEFRDLMPHQPTANLLAPDIQGIDPGPRPAATWAGIFMIRGDDVTFVQSETPDSLKREDAYHLERGLITSIGPSVRSIEFPMGWERDPRNVVVEVSPDERGLAFLASELSQAKQALGFSLGYPVISIDSVTQEPDGGWSATGRVRIGEIDSKVDFTVDRDLVIRSSRIIVIGSQIATIFEVECSGIEVHSRLSFAHDGIFRRLRAHVIEGVIGEDHDLEVEQQFEFQDFQSNVSNAIYDATTKFEVPEGAQINDWVSNVTYRKGDEKNSRPLR